VSSPPPDAETLRRRANELVSVLSRFADEETIAALRRVRELTRRDDYERLRTATRARTELTDDELERLRSGAVESDLAELRDARDALAEALSEDGG
jgi:aminoglycoside N3'-acetyltransferase